MFRLKYDQIILLKNILYIKKRTYFCANKRTFIETLFK